MHGLEKKIYSIIKGNQLILAGETVLVGVSGGPDSTALLLVLSHLQERLGCSLRTLYVDHGLRPDETGPEQDFLTKLCEQLSVPLTIKTVDVPAEVALHKESTEQAARKLRYECLEAVAGEVSATKIGVGHTADDQAEELLLRLIRGTARAGMGGMKLLRDDCLIRPLLHVTKEELLSYLGDRHMTFMEDSSNQSSLYLRNQVRHELLPFLRQYNPSIEVNLRSLAEILQDEEDLLEGQTTEIWQDMVEVAVDADNQPTVRWDCGDFNVLHLAMRRRLSEKMFIHMASPPSFDKIKQLLYLCQHGEGGASLHFAHGMRAVKKKGIMTFWYPQGVTNRKGNLF